MFNEVSIDSFRKNIYVKNVSNKGITYTNKFKVRFIAEYQNGKLPIAIFEDAGFDIDIIGMVRVHSATERWKKA